MIETLTADIVDDVRQQLASVATIIREEITDRRMTFYVNPKLAIASKRRLDTEGEIIRKYCNHPYCLYVDDSIYRFTMTCN